jgi:hypothetical protein
VGSGGSYGGSGGGLIQLLPETLQVAAVQWQNQCSPFLQFVPESDFRYSSDPVSQAVASATQDWQSINQLRADQEGQLQSNIVNACFSTSSIMVASSQKGADGISSVDGLTLT